MIVFDTSIWIAFFKRQADVFALAKAILEDGECLAVECIFGELLQGAKNRRERELIVSYWNHLPHSEPQNAWIEAGKYSGEHSLISKGIGLIDALIMVTAHRSSAKVWTRDKKLLGFMEKDYIFLP
jgi:hypothetical protein